MDVRIDKKWLIGGGIGTAAFVVLVLAAWLIPSINIPLVGEGASSTPSQARAHSDVDDASVPGLDLQHCVDLWNQPSEARSRSSMAALVASYVSVTTSNLYPGKCLVTGANPQLDLSAQFLESDSGRYAYDQVGSGEANSLPPSVTNWNASADGEGSLALTR